VRPDETYGIERNRRSIANRSGVQKKHKTFYNPVIG